MKKTFLIFLVLLVCGQAVAQSTGDGEGTSEPPDYEPYSEDEYPDWLHEVRRAEVILIGSFPLTMLFSSLAYEGFRAVLNGIEGNQTAGNQAFGSGGFTPDEAKGILISGVILSVAVAAADFILGKLGVTPRE